MTIGIRPNAADVKVGMNASMWHSSVRLAALLSILVGALAYLVAERVGAGVFLIGVFAGASVLGWANVERFRQTARS